MKIRLTPSQKAVVDASPFVEWSDDSAELFLHDTDDLRNYTGAALPSGIFTVHPPMEAVGLRGSRLTAPSELWETHEWEELPDPDAGEGIDVFGALHPTPAHALAPLLGIARFDVSFDPYGHRTMQVRLLSPESEAGDAAEVEARKRLDSCQIARQV